MNMTQSSCPGCANLARISPTLKCNAHRVQSMSSALIDRARAAGHTVADGDWAGAEKALNARKVVIGMTGGEIQLPSPGTRVQVIIDGRVVISGGRACIRTAGGLLIELPAGARKLCRVLP